MRNTSSAANRWKVRQAGLDRELGTVIVALENYSGHACVSATGNDRILNEARALLALPGNDFAWSSWEDAAAALAELDAAIAALGAQCSCRRNSNWLSCSRRPVRSRKSA